MPDTSVIFHNVSFTYDTASIPLLTGLMAHFPIGWTGIVGANGSGKTTVLRLATGELVPQGGAVQGTADALYCAQRTDTAPPRLAAFIRATDSVACEIAGRLHLEATWVERWQTLSHGERKRAQIGVALWCQPRVLAIDEPTNHLDDAARQLLITPLRAFSGVGLLVSHDRVLLDALCHQCLFLDPTAATMRPGGITRGMQQAAQEMAHQRDQAALARRERVKLEREVIRRREEAARSQARRSKRGLARQDHDARAKKNLARLTGKDATGGKLLRQLSGRLEQARHKEEHSAVSKTYRLGIWLPGAYSTRNTLLALAAGTLPLGPARQLHLPPLVLQPQDRIALTGPNGGGKSTLVRHIVASTTLPADRLLYIPQEIDTSTAQALLARIHALPREQRGHLMTIVSRLGSRPSRLLDTAVPSPGEVRKLMLARGITQTPHLIIMDEPTNHLDLPSLACLEEALVECPCAVLLVSHDQYFLRRLTTSRWHIAAAQPGEPHGDMRLRVHEPFTSGSTAPTAAGQPASVPKRPG